MTKPWKQIREEKSKLSHEQRAVIDEHVDRAVCTLRQLRQAHKMTQVSLGVRMELTQAEVSKLEHREDIYVSTLSRFVEAMGGEIEILAKFPGRPDVPLAIGSLPDREEVRVG